MRHIILSISLVSFVGIIISVILSSVRVRRAIESAYVQVDDEAKGLSPTKELLPFANQLISLFLLTKSGAVSAKKTLMIAIATSFMFSASFDHSTFPSVLSGVAEDTGLSGLALRVTFALFLMFTPVPFHWLTEYILARVGGHIIRTGTPGSTVRIISKLLILTVCWIVVSTLSAYLLLFELSAEHPVAQAIIMPSIMNAPSLVPVMVFGSLRQESTIHALQLIGLCFSAMGFSAVLILIAIAFVVSKNKTVLIFFSKLLAMLSATDARYLLGFFVTTFGVTTGLCQVFGYQF